MRATTVSPLLAVALVLAATPARAQQPGIDARWIAYVGCWESLAVTKSTLCVLPVGKATVDLVTIDSGVVTAAERIVVGERVATTQGECSGWQTADWSTVSDRLYLQSEESCPRGGTHTANGLIALARDGALLYIQGGTIGVKTGVAVQRYRKAETGIALPSEVKDALDAVSLDMTAKARARASAMAPLMIDDVTEATRYLENDVVVAWLVERGGSINLDAQRLIELADAGVPSTTIDVLVALAYPNVFAINSRNPQRELVDAGVTYGPPPSYGSCGVDFAFGYGYGSPYCGGFDLYGGYGYGAWYPGYPYVIVYSGTGGGGGSGDGARSHGRVVNGKGYQEGQGSTDEVSRPAQPRSDTGGSSFSGRSSSSSPSSSSGEQRTAKPRP